MQPHTDPYVAWQPHTDPYVAWQPHTDPYVAWQPHTDPYVAWQPHTDPYVAWHAQSCLPVPSCQKNIFCLDITVVYLKVKRAHMWIMSLGMMTSYHCSKPQRTLLAIEVVCLTDRASMIITLQQKALFFTPPISPSLPPFRSPPSPPHSPSTLSHRTCLSLTLLE